MAIKDVRRNQGFLPRLIGTVWDHGQEHLFEDPCGRTWAREVKCFEELPKIYQEFMDSLLSQGREPFPYAVVMPTFKGGYRHPQRERLVFKLGSDIHVMEDSEGGLGATRYPIENVDFVERGSILLHAWITIRGEDAKGEVRSTTLRFNSVTDHIMAPFIEAMRAPTTAGSSADLKTERSRLDFLGRTYLKFRSYGQSSVRPGARVMTIVFQREIRSEVARLLKFSLTRLQSPTHLGILTDSELILLRDDDTQRWLKGPPHGAIWLYVPRRQIVDASLSSGSKSIQTLSIALRGGSRIEAPFEASQGSNLEQMVEAIRS